ncbi:MAG: hypothetical protein WBG38_02895, partial [Nodosilinea sp.]
KQAILYEVIAEETTEEAISNRRRQGIQRSSTPAHQLELVSIKPVYTADPLPSAPRAAEAPPSDSEQQSPWNPPKDS